MNVDTASGGKVATEGKLGGQAQVGGVAGTWKDLTDNVNLMAGNLAGQVRNIAEVATAIANGDLPPSSRICVRMGESLIPPGIELAPSRCCARREVR